MVQTHDRDEKKKEALEARLKELNAGESIAKQYPTFGQFMMQDALDHCREGTLNELRQSERSTGGTEVGKY